MGEKATGFTPCARAALKPQRWGEKLSQDLCHVTFDVRESVQAASSL